MGLLEVTNLEAVAAFQAHDHPARMIVTRMGRDRHGLGARERLEHGRRRFRRRRARTKHIIVIVDHLLLCRWHEHQIRRQPEH